MAFVSNSSHPLLEIEKDEATLEFSNLTCLSPHVHQIVHAPIPTSILQNSSNFLDSNGRLNWQLITKHWLSSPSDEIDIPGDRQNDIDRVWYVSSIRAHAIALECQRFVEKVGENLVSGKFPDLISWPHKHNTYIDRIHKEAFKTKNTILGFSALVTIIERFLGDLFINIEEKKQLEVKLRRKPPPLVRDLLLTPELSDALGEDCIFLLQVLIGSSRSLNLRNIIWHGFALPNEFEFSMYCLLLMWILNAQYLPIKVPPSDGQQSITILEMSSLKCKELKQLNTSSSEEEYDFGFGKLCLLSKTSRFEFEAKLLPLFKSMKFIIPKRFIVFQEAMDYFFKGVESNDSWNFFFCLISLLPVMEHCIRRAWILANELPYQLFCADSYRYYTILDMFLEETLRENLTVEEFTSTNLNVELDESLMESSSSSILQNNNGNNNGANGKNTSKLACTNPLYNNKKSQNAKPNRFWLIMGDGIMTALNDWFLYPMGQRPRDRISHGEVSPNSIPFTMTARCIEMFMCLCIQFESVINPEHSSLLSLQHPETASLKLFFDNYVSCFHPYTIVQKSMRQCHNTQWNSWVQLVKTIPASRQGGDFHDDSKPFRRELSPETFELLSTVQTSISQSFKCSFQIWLAQNSHHAIKRLDLAKRFRPEFQTYSYSKNCIIPLIPLQYHKMSSNSLSFVIMQHKVLTELQGILDLWTSQLKAQLESILAGTATTRLQGSFYKQMGLLNSFTLWASAVLQHLQICIFDMATEYTTSPSESLSPPVGNSIPSSSTSSQLLKMQLPSGPNHHLNPKLLKSLLKTLIDIKQDLPKNGWNLILDYIYQSARALNECYP